MMKHHIGTQVMRAIIEEVAAQARFPPVYSVHGRGRDICAAQLLWQGHAHHAQCCQLRHMAGSGQAVLIDLPRAAQGSRWQAGHCVSWLRQSSGLHAKLVCLVHFTGSLRTSAKRCDMAGLTIAARGTAARRSPAAARPSACRCAGPAQARLGSSGQSRQTSRAAARAQPGHMDRPRRTAGRAPDLLGFEGLRHGPLTAAGHAGGLQLRHHLTQRCAGPLNRGDQLALGARRSSSAASARPARNQARQSSAASVANSLLVSTASAKCPSRARHAKRCRKIPIAAAPRARP